ncbi:MAG: cell filamentation protein Fic, partial [Propionibacteriaceae bacterium]|nr:cell filamentation protein Fic [Propionibacteriaceae bacterium]
MSDNKGKILLYQTDDGKVAVDVRFEGETFWLTQKALAELFGTTVANINIHIKNIFDEGELEEGATIKDSLIVQIEGSR